MVKKKVSIFLVFVMVVSLVVGCGQSEETGVSDGMTVITLPTYRSGENVGAKVFLPQVQRFNALYEGKYRIDIETTTDSTHSDVIKNLGNQNDLPPLFQFPDYTYAEQNFFNEDVLLDLSDWLSKNPDVKNVFVEEAIDYVTQEDGSIYALPISVIRPTGIYVNGNTYAPEKPLSQMSWDELGKSMANQDAEYGVQTMNAGWLINLTTVSMMGTLEGGKAILEAGLDEKITDITAPQWVETFRMMKDFYQQAGYASGLGKDYPDIENAFINNLVSVMPNGQWIISVFDPEGERAKDWGTGFDGENVDGHYFPGNVAIANPKIYDWYVSAKASEKEQEVALAFLAFINSPEEIEAFILGEGGSNSKIEYSPSFVKEIEENRLASDFVQGVDDDTVYVLFLHEVVTDSVMNGISNNIPLLFEGTMTPEEFCETVTAFATE